MRALRFILPAVILIVAMLVSTSTSFGKPEYTKKEKKGCVVCHVTATSKELNDAGKYYKEKKTLDGYKK